MATHPGPDRDRWPTGVVAAAVFVLALLLFLFVLRPTPWRPGDPERVEPGEVLSFEAAVTGDLTPVAVRPADRFRVRASRVDWRDETGATWLRAPAVAFSVRVAGALAGRVVIEDGIIESPEVVLVQRAPDVWNFHAPLAAILDGPAPRRAGPPADVRLRDIAVRNGRITVRTLEATVEAAAVQASLASAVLSAPGVVAPTINLRTVEAQLTLPDTADRRFTRQVALSDARFRLPDGAVEFEVARARFGSSVATDGRGEWNPGLGGLGLRLAATVERLDLADVPWLRAEVPEHAVASFGLRIEPLPGDRSAVVVTGLDLRSETSVATGSLRAVHGPAGFVLESIDLRVDPLSLRLVEAFTGPLPYLGDLRGTIRGEAGDIAFDLMASLATSPLAQRFTVNLDGRLAFMDPGIELRHVLARLEAVPLAALEPLVPGLPIEGPVTGTVRLDGAPGDVPIRIDLRLETARGVVSARGMLDLTGPSPTYELTGHVTGIDLDLILAPSVPPVLLDAAFALSGVGTSPETARASLRADGTFAGWRARPGDTVAVQVDLVAGQLRAHEIRLDLGPIHLAASGDWRFANGAGGAIRYALIIESLEPLSPFLPPAPGRSVTFAQGRVEAEGTVAGTLDAPALAGRLLAQSFLYDDWAADRLEGTYDVRFGPEHPHVSADLTARDLRTPGGDFRTAAVRLELVRPVFELAIHGERTRGEGVVMIEADGRIGVDEHDIVVRRVELDLEDQRWRLPEPARIERLATGLTRVTGLRLERADGEGVIVLNGIIAPADLTDLELEVAALPVGALLALVRADIDLAGDLWLRATLRGPELAPELDATFELVDGEIQGVEVTRLDGRATYRAGRFVVAARGLVVDTAEVQLEGALPISISLGLPPGLELDGDGPVELRLVTEAFPLDMLDPAIAAIRDLSGSLSAELLMTGTPATPRLGGGLTVVAGEATVPLLSQRYTGIEATAVLDGQRLVIERMVARSDGQASVTGVIRFDDLTNPGLDLVAELNRFRAQGVSGRRDAAATGRIAIRGTALVPVLSGSIALGDGTLDIRMLTDAPRFDQELIGIGGAFDPFAPIPIEPVEPTERGVRITRLNLTAGPDLWFQTDEVRVQLAGELTIEMPGPDPMISGQLRGDRGTFNLRIGPATRRFDIIEANLQFFGTPGPDPGIDITAARIIPGPDRTDFELRVRLTGSFSGPVVAFAAEDGTAIPAEEALNFLIFGRATATLADFPGAGLASTQGLYDALAFYGAFDWLSVALAEQFGAGIDYFQVQVRSGVGDAGPELFFLLGQEVVPDMFVMVTLPTTEFEARWALTGEWRIDRQWTLEAGYEPPDVILGIGGVGGHRLPFATQRDQQLFMSIRRRWTY